MTDTSHLRQADFIIEGMMCEGCVSRVEETLRSVEGVEMVAVTMGSAQVAYEPHTVDPAALRAAVARAGYRIAPPSRRKKGPIGRWLDRMIAANQKSFGSRSLDCCKLNRPSEG